MLSRQGYKLKKEDLSEEQIHKLIKDLTAKPKVVQGFGPLQKPIEYPIFLESKTGYYVPRFYGQKEFGPITTNKLGSGDDIDLQFKGKLRPEQIPIKQLFLDEDKGNGAGGIISLKC